MKDVVVDNNNNENNAVVIPMTTTITTSKFRKAIYLIGILAFSFCIYYYDAEVVLKSVDLKLQNPSVGIAREKKQQIKREPQQQQQQQRGKDDDDYEDDEDHSVTTTTTTTTAAATFAALTDATAADTAGVFLLLRLVHCVSKILL